LSGQKWNQNRNIGFNRPKDLDEIMEYLKNIQITLSGNTPEKTLIQSKKLSFKPEVTNSQSSEMIRGSNQEPSANKTRLSFSDFSFSKSRKALEDYKGSFSDTVIEERRAEL